MFEQLKKWFRSLSLRGRVRPIDLASPQEAQHIQSEADHLSDVVSRTEGLLPESDMSRLNDLTAELNRLTERAKKREV
jgi:hypothetical protein